MKMTCKGHKEDPSYDVAYKVSLQLLGDAIATG